MSRSALIVSLALHAGFLFFVGWRLTSTAARIGPGQPGTDASFSADNASGSLLVVAVPAGPPEPAPEPQFAQPDFVQPAPVVVLPAAPISAIAVLPAQLPVATGIPSEMPAVKAKASPSKNRKATHGALARSGGNVGGQRGTGAAGDGGGLRGAGFVPPQFRIRYKPLYPEEARAQRLEGTVLLLVSIDAAGRVTGRNVLQSCGHTVLDRAALAAVGSWRFDPARQDGVAIAAQVEVPVRFRFEERQAPHA